MNDDKSHTNWLKLAFLFALLALFASASNCAFDSIENHKVNLAVEVGVSNSLNQIGFKISPSLLL